METLPVLPFLHFFCRLFTFTASTNAAGGGVGGGGGGGKKGSPAVSPKKKKGHGSVSQLDDEDLQYDLMTGSTGSLITALHGTEDSVGNASNTAPTSPAAKFVQLFDFSPACWPTPAACCFAVHTGFC